MLQEITLRPMQGTHTMTTRFSGKYFDKERGQNILLVGLGGNKYGVCIDRDNTKTETPFSKWFGENNRDFTLIWDDVSDKKTSEFVNYLQRHTQVHTDGWENPNRQGSPQFIFIDKRKQNDLKVAKLKEKAVVFNMMNNMRIDEFMNVCFFVGHNPVGKSFEETFVTLLDFDTDENGMPKGILMKNPSRFLTDWASPDQNFTVFVRKAIDLKIITTRDGKYYVNTEIVGDSVDGVIAYMKVNDKLYEYVQRQVSERDILPLDVNRGNVKVGDVSAEPKEAKEKKIVTLGDKADKTVKKESESIADHDERAALKAKMKKYGMKGYQMMEQWSIETCRNKIAAFEQEHKELVTA